MISVGVTSANLNYALAATAFPPRGSVSPSRNGNFAGAYATSRLDALNTKERADRQEKQRNEPSPIDGTTLSRGGEELSHPRPSPPDPPPHEPCHGSRHSLSLSLSLSLYPTCALCLPLPLPPSTPHLHFY